MRDTTPTSPNYYRRRSFAGVPAVVAGAAIVSVLGGSVISGEDNAPQPSMYLAPGFGVVSGSEELGNRVVTIQKGSNEAT